MWRGAVGRLLILGAFVAGVLAAGCGGGGSDGGTPPQSVVETLVSGNVYTDNVAAGVTRRFAFEGLGAGRYAVALSGLDADADLALSGGTCVHALLHASGSNPEDCTIDVVSSRFAVDVTGKQATKFTLSVGSATEVPAPVSEGAPHIFNLPGAPVPLAIGVPTTGQVGTRGTSYYKFSGLIPGTHTVTIWGASDTAIMHLYTDDTYSGEIDCTLRTIRASPAECTVATTTGFVYLSVSAGQFNRVGATFLMLVR